MAKPLCLEAFDRWPLEVEWAQSMGQLTLTHRLEAGCCENFPGWAHLLGTAVIARARCPRGRRSELSA